MDEQWEREARAGAEEQLRSLPREERERKLGPLRRHVLDRHPGIPPEEIVIEGLGLEEFLEEVWVRGLMQIQANARAKFHEHVADEEFVRWIRDEFDRLYPEHPDGVPEDVIIEAVLERTRRERPQAWSTPKKSP